MAPESHGEARERLSALRKLYARQLPDRLRQIEAGCRRLVTADLDAEAFQRLLLLVRSLGSSGETFGYLTLGYTARELETLLGGHGWNQPLERSREEELRQRLGELRKIVALEVGGIEMDEEVGVERALERLKASKLLFLLEGDSGVAADLGFQLGCFGYLVRSVSTADQLAASLEQTAPAAILVDLDLPGAAEAVADLTDGWGRPIHEASPLVAISSCGDFDSRVAAVRLGADAYLTKPIDLHELAAKLDLVARHRSENPYRVLIATAEYRRALELAITLQQSGMSPQLVDEPVNTLELLDETRPDVVLMDLELPGYDGPELAALIRQRNEHLHLPIVFLADGATLERQLSAIRRGGDDILEGSSEAEELISVVRQHAQRSRMLGYLASRDGLTGLLNYRCTMEALERAVGDAVGQGGNLSLALLDVDDLVWINETYGYRSGDSVLESLAHLLRLRFRRGDVLGRSGDELYVILPDTAAPDARKILEEIRAVFAEIRHQSGDASYYATFSCGVASLAEGGDALRLQNAARRALSDAGRLGRNRVVLAG